MSDADTKSPSLSEMVRRRIERATSKIRVMVPGVVVSFDPDERRAVVRPAIDSVERDERGVDVLVKAKQIEDVPVLTVGSRTTRVKFPIVAGDHCMLLFSHASLVRWKTTGQVGDPGDRRRHQVSDVVAIPGLSAFDDVEDDAAAIEFTDAGLILIGDATADFTIRATAYRAAEDGVRNSLRTLVDLLVAKVLLLSGPDPAITAALGAFDLADTAFTNATSTFVTTVVKVK